MTVGNIKFIEKRGKGSETLMETMTKGRVYVVVDRGKPNSIVYLDTDNKRSKQIDLQEHKGLNPHVHHDCLHNEYSPNGQPTRLSAGQSRMVDMVLSQWEEYINAGSSTDWSALNRGDPGSNPGTCRAVLLDGFFMLIGGSEWRSRNRRLSSQTHSSRRNGTS